MSHHTDPPRAASRTTVAALCLTAVLVAVALCTALFPRHLPTPRNPQVVDVVFDSRPVIWAARLLLVSLAFVLAVGGAFVVASAVARARNGDWLKRAGPFEVSEAVVANLEDQVHLWQSAARDSYEQLDAVRARFDEASELIEQEHLDDDYDKL